jgi:fimbrial chaperone protein
MSATEACGQLRCKVTRMRLTIAKWVGRVGLLTALGLVPGAVIALTISPVIVELSPARRVVSVTVSNPTDSALNFQAEVLAWSQPNGQDHYEQTDDLMVVPPIAEIAPGASQIFRITPRTPPGTREQAYRLILEDVTAETSQAANAAMVSIRVRHSLPVFVAASLKPRTAARVGQCAAPAGRGCIRLNNDGERYLMAKALVVEAGEWRKEVSLGTRLLAGAWREWSFDLPSNLAGPLRVQVDTSLGPVAGEIPAMAR